MRIRTFMMCLCAALAACEASQEARVVSAVPLEEPAAAPEKDAISAVPEHFDRVRAEQFENEEDRLRRKGREN